MIQIQLLIFTVFLVLISSASSSSAPLDSAKNKLRQEQSQKLSFNKAPYWVQLRSNHHLDDQVVTFLTENASIIILNSKINDPIDYYQLSTIVNRLHQANSSLPVLLYTWVSHYIPTNHTTSDEMMGWLQKHPELHVFSPEGKPMEYYGDVTKLEYRSHVVDGVTNIIKQINADGIAVDLAFRTLKFRPIPLTRLCKKNAELCDQYPDGMDNIFSEVKKSLGSKLLLYNGLWNFGPGMIEDQLKLLKYADIVAIEFFGLNLVEKERKHTFSEDILPYLQVIKNLPADKKVLAFGRGFESYTDYREDYLWQRYLYCAYLLGKQENTFFKYHTSFSAPAYIGRSGGLDTYADWQIDLGNPEKEYQIKDGLYFRKFDKALVVVAPDDGKEGKLTLDTPLYTPEGKEVSGEIKIPPGTGEILLKEKRAATTDLVVIDSHNLSLFKDWQKSEIIKDDKNLSYVKLSSTPKSMEGEHDLLLNLDRFLNSPSILNLNIRFRNSDAKALLVAEVDDPKHNTGLVVIEVASKSEELPADYIASPILFRTPFSSKIVAKKRWPYIPGPLLTTVQWHKLKLDGNKLLLHYKFKRWSHVRFVGDVDLMQVSVSSD
ncbi:putative glycoside hydrolase family 15 protein [Candidatus Nitrosacidococcus sp. I8]|uniref:putative glycoside hydrolase family 15 protein n=1 Tax=Candidatus Nitrosacidococcus sp. I8 TaxID=2942908 RepID=UPI0022270EDF|nr:putative glycoside hydrolase family 15 protein [Candidatus Nitrosacidococcus sp. I8]CAH9018342.1 hypothetical protein NURINAE_00870 [Candidatus Nitrosacidococcus sp. I8]